MSAQVFRSVAGLDTASNRFHLYLNDGRTFKHNCSKNGSKEKDPDDRRQELYENAKYTFSILPRGTVICCEEPIALKNGKTTRLLSLAAGAIWAAHLQFDVFWTWVDIAQWKRSVVGHGGADKDAIAMWVLMNMGKGWVEKDDADFYDAAAICRYGELKLGVSTG